MKIIVSPDSFKGSLTAIQAAYSIKKGIKKAYNKARPILLPLGDGGEGTMEVLISATKGHSKITETVDPLGNKIKTSYGITGDNKTCIIEIAITSGIKLISEHELNPLQTTTYGVGQLIKQALNEGYYSFIVNIGGSATNDGGAGMLQALGLQLLDSNGDEIKYGGGSLNKVVEIDDTYFDERIKECTFIIATDVQNPLIGKNGASFIFGPQKGATEKEVELLDDNLVHWANLIKKKTGVILHNKKGAGAAGGLGGAFQAFFPSQMKRGIDVVLEYLDYEKQLEDADLIITGEGKVDKQTGFGKTPMGVAQCGLRKNVPIIIMTGIVGKGYEVLYDYGVVSINSIITRPMSVTEAIKNASILLENSTEQIVRSFFY